MLEIMESGLESRPTCPAAKQDELKAWLGFAAARSVPNRLCYIRNQMDTEPMLGSVCFPIVTSKSGTGACQACKGKGLYCRILAQNGNFEGPRHLS